MVKPLILADEHRAVIGEHKRHCLVQGGPGSGKTTLALLKGTDRIKDGLAPGQNILFLSFSRSAVARITDAAGRDFPTIDKRLLAVQTFHSFFWQVLQAHGYLLGAPRKLSVVLSHEEASLREGIDRDDSRWPAWEARRNGLFFKEGRVCFDLFAPSVAQLFKASKTLRHRYSKRYPLILVDEAQDTGDDQWNCLKLLAEQSQIVCLADPDQMIFRGLPGLGASPKRISHIRATFTPVEVDLGTSNHRSPGTDIGTFARDIYKGYVRAAGYSNVSILPFNPEASLRDKAIRKSVGYLAKLIKKKTGAPAQSIALIPTYASGVAIISAALQLDKPIPHHVLFDESFALLGARVAAFLLEPKTPAHTQNDVAMFLELVAAAHSAKGSQGGRQIRDRYLAYAHQLRSGANLSFKPISVARSILGQVHKRKMEGDPRRDWSAVKGLLRASNHDPYEDLAKHLDYLVAFARGKRIAENLSESWLEHGNYTAARKALDSALAQDQLLSGSDHLDGIHVMNAHKAKGKQFDGVILYQQQYTSPFAWRNEAAPFPEGRRLLHMAATRAKKHVLILREAFPACPLLTHHNLI